MPQYPGLDVDYIALERSSETMTVPAETLLSALANFYRRRDSWTPRPGGPKNPWGEDDEMAQLFNNEYVGKATTMLEGIATLADGLAGLTDNIKLMAVNYDRAEDANSSSI